MDLTNDIDEFKTVLPKSGHRLKIKKVVNQAKESDGASAILSNADSTDNTTQNKDEQDSVSFPLYLSVS